MRILFIILILFFGIGGLFFLRPSGEKEVKSITTAAVSPVAQKHADIPVTLTIPKLQVETDVEIVAMDSQGRMDIPKNANNVAWYKLGSKPGEKGNAVMAGHFDKSSGAPAIFYKIHTLLPGDKIITTDSKGKKYTFSVVKTENYPYDNFPLQKVFGSSEKSMLNLITCEGTWDKITKNYSRRTVVYAEQDK